MSRQILPTNSTSSPSFGSSKPDHSSNPPPERPQGGPSKPTYAKRGKITIVACVPCRKRKTKCDGQRPTCSQCVAREGSCVYDMTDEQRRLTFLRDNVEQLAEEKAALEALLATLQSGPNDDAMQLMQRLRAPGEGSAVLAREVHAAHMLPREAAQGDATLSQSERSTEEMPRPLLKTGQMELLLQIMTQARPAELDEILQRLRVNEGVSSILGAIQSNKLLQPLPQQTGAATPGLETDYSTRATTFGLVKGAAYQESNAPLAHAPLEQSQKWTSVTDDQEYIDHLLDLYFAWQHAFFQSFPEDLFRKDMISGETRYCSKLLVNSICAAGSLLSQRPRSRRDPRDSKTAGLDFFDEAVSLLSLETRASSIPTTAALFLLCHVEGNRGRLSSLWMFSGQSSRMALDLNLHLRTDLRQHEDTDDARREEFARRHAFWGCFISDQVTSFTLGRVPQIPISAVTIEMPPIEEKLDDEPWSAHDISGPSKPGARATTFNQCAALSKIVNSTLCMFFAPTRAISGSLLLNEYSKYLNWHKRLPLLVSSIDDAPPHVLSMHMYYHSAVLLLFRPFLKANFTESDISPRDVCRSSANAISDIFAQHHRLYGVIGLYTFQVHCLLTACTIHIVNIPAIASSTYLTTACNSFHDLVPFNEWAAGSLNIIRGLVQKWNIVLPVEAETALYRNASPVTNLGFVSDPERAQETFLAEPSTISPSIENPVDDTAGPSPFTAEMNTSSKRPMQPYFHPPSQQMLPKRQRLQPRPNFPGPRGSGEQYLFAPFPHQPAPLMGPIHTSEGIRNDDYDGQESDTLLDRVAQGFDGLNFEGDGIFDSFMGWNTFDESPNRLGRGL